LFVLLVSIFSQKAHTTPNSVQNYKKMSKAESETEKDGHFRRFFLIFLKYCTRALAYMKKMLYLCGLFVEKIHIKQT